MLLLEYNINFVSILPPYCTVQLDQLSQSQATSARYHYNTHLRIRRKWPTWKFHNAETPQIHSPFFHAAHALFPLRNNLGNGMSDDNPRLFNFLLTKPTRNTNF